VDHRSEWRESHYDSFDQTHQQQPQQQQQEQKNANGNESTGNDEPTTAEGGEVVTIQLRGLAASRNIHSGEVVISIPFHALLTITTTIDHCPVLSGILGPEAREQYGWGTGYGGGGDVGVTNYEIPLLVVAILYHRSLGSLSPMMPYIEVLSSAPMGGIPFLWDDAKLQRMEGRGKITRGVREICEGINGNLREIYDSIMEVLVQEHGDIFGRPDFVKDGSDNEEDDDDGGGSVDEKVEWMYSYEKFQWAFAIVNSRRWNLPLQDLDNDVLLTEQQPIQKDDDQLPLSVTPNSNPKNQKASSPKGEEEEPTNPPEESESITTPPATQPTDSFVSQQSEVMKNAHIEEYGDDAADVNANMKDGKAVDSDTESQHQQQQPQDTTTTTKKNIANPTSTSPIPKHSFLPPLADLLNFGPPCTRGRYNPTTKAFEVIATCPFLSGQEVTFWYSDDCDDAMIANYGFTHPMVPSCQTLEDWRSRSELWRRYARELEGELEEVYAELGRVQGVCGDCSGKGSDDYVDGGMSDGLEGGDGFVSADGKDNAPTEQEEEEVGSIRKMRLRYNEDLGL